MVGRPGALREPFTDYDGFPGAAYHVRAASKQTVVMRCSVAHWSGGIPMHLRTSVLTACFLGVLLVPGGPVIGAERHRLLGKWALDVSKLTVPNPPRSVTIVLAEVAGEKYRMSVDIVDHEGAKSHGEGVFKADGTASRATGSLDVDIVSMTMPSRKILVMGAGIAGHPGNTRVFSLSDDGKHMIETVVGHRSDGTPTTRVDIWSRR
jgi:hypothetical protein